MKPLADEFLSATVETFRSQKTLAERAVAQLADAQLRTALSPETNSVAVIMKHVAGNLRSRWTDFLTSDGEKPWRQRDAEFEDQFADRAELMAWWEAGWQVLFDALAALRPADLGRTITIRGQEHSVPLAIQRALAHVGYHTGQIVQVARVLAGDQWETLTIPRGGSDAFNRQKREET